MQLIRCLLSNFLSQHVSAICVCTAHDASPQDHSQPLLPRHPGRTPHVVGHGLILLMMGIMMPETCWDRKFDNKHRISCILLVLSLHLLSIHYFKIVSLLLQTETVKSTNTLINHSFSNHFNIVPPSTPMYLWSALIFVM